jgi:hypothetical protein
MAVQAAPGQVAVPAANATGSVLCAWDAPEVVNLNPSPPSGTNRIDLITCQSHGQDLDGGTVDDFVVTFVAGAQAAAGGEVAPAVPPGAVALAQVRIHGGAAAVVAGDITDVRPGSLAVPLVATSTPRGFVISATGPAAQTDCPSGGATLVSLNPTLTAGRKYLVSAYCSGTQTTATGSNIATLNGVDMGSPRIWTNTNDAAGNARAGGMAMMVTAASTGARALTIVALATAGVFRVSPNTCELSVTDIGGT